jgi:excisionase family DNA binding protein
MDKLLTPQEMARVLGVQPSTIYQWTHQGFIPHVKLGKFVRFKEGDVLKWVEERTTDGRSVRKIDVRELGM